MGHKVKSAKCEAQSMGVNSIEMQSMGSQSIGAQSGSTHLFSLNMFRISIDREPLSFRINRICLIKRLLTKYVSIKSITTY